MSYKYKYIGQGERHLPDIQKSVYEGEIFETEKQINNPDFIEIQDIKPVVKVKSRRHKKL